MPKGSKNNNTNNNKNGSLLNKGHLLGNTFLFGSEVLNAREQSPLLKNVVTTLLNYRMSAGWDSVIASLA